MRRMKTMSYQEEDSQMANTLHKAATVANDT